MKGGRVSTPGTSIEIHHAKISVRILTAAEHMMSPEKDFEGIILMTLGAPCMSGREILSRDLSESSFLAA